MFCRLLEYFLDRVKRSRSKPAIFVRLARADGIEFGVT